MKRVDCATKQARAITLLAKGVSCKETAELIGVAPPTISRWLHEEEFVSGLEAAKAEERAALEGTWKEEVIHKMMASVGEVTDALIAKAKEGDVTAARTIYDRLGLVAVQEHKVEVDTKWDGLTPQEQYARGQKALEVYARAHGLNGHSQDEGAVSRERGWH